MSFSEPELVFCSVPEGIILGLIIFLVIMNDFADNCEDH